MNGTASQIQDHHHLLLLITFLLLLFNVWVLTSTSAGNGAQNTMTMISDPISWQSDSPPEALDEIDLRLRSPLQSTFMTKFPISSSKLKDLCRRGDVSQYQSTLHTRSTPLLAILLQLPSQCPLKVNRVRPRNVCSNEIGWRRILRPDAKGFCGLLSKSLFIKCRKKMGEFLHLQGFYEQWQPTRVEHHMHYIFLH